MGPGLDLDVREALAMFADELSAHRYLERMLWPDGVRCPRCDSARVGKLNGASTRLGTYKCYGCRKAFSLLHGTVMSSSHVPAHKWLQAIYLTDCGTRPVRPCHLQQILDVSYKTACSMLRRIGEAADSLSPASTTGAPSLASRAPAPSAGIANDRWLWHDRRCWRTLEPGRYQSSTAAHPTSVRDQDFRSPPDREQG